MPAVIVPDFLPSRCGFRFANAFPRGPVFRLPVLRLPVGDASRGLCGGMIYAACDLFHGRAEPPPDDVPPAYGTPLFRHFVRRLFDSFHLPWGPMKYYAWMRVPESVTRTVLLHRTVRHEWPRVRRDLDGGHPAALGLVRVCTRNPLR